MDNSKKNDLSVSVSVNNILKGGNMDKEKLDLEIRRLAHELAMEDLKAWLENKSSTEAHFVRYDSDRDDDTQVDNNDPESMMIAMEEGGEIELSKAEDDVEEDKEEKDDVAEKRQFNVFLNRHIRRLNWELKDFQERINAVKEEKEKAVTVRFVDIVVELEDGTENREYIGAEGRRMTVEEFEYFMNKNMLHGYRGHGFVQGYSDLRDLELNLADFSDTGLVPVGPKSYILPKTRERVIRQKRRMVTDAQTTIYIGCGIYETINRGDYLGAMTGYMGETEILSYLMRSEILYGLANEFSIDEYEPDTQEIISDMENEGYNNGYDFRDGKEKSYWFNHYKVALTNANTYAQLFQSSVGVLFPKENKELAENSPMRKQWMRPHNAMSKEQRSILLDLYHEKAEEFKVARAEAEEKLDEVLILLDDPRITDMDKALKTMLTPKDAGLVISAASSRAKRTGQQCLSKSDWWRIKRIADKVEVKPVEITDAVRNALSKLSSIKFQDANLRAEAIKEKFAADEAEELLDYGNQMLKVNNKKVLNYTDYKALVDVKGKK